jgi:succinate dehydrogenase/fumarate reductase flavoprotein subunit
LGKPVDCDVLVVGSGAAGLAAAAAAAAQGLKVILAEKDRYIGGTTALSGGFMWIPCATVAVQAGVIDTTDDARTYLQDQAGEFFNAECVDAFLANGPAAVSFFNANTSLHFEAAPDFSDYHPDAPGGKAGGRSILARPLDGRELGKDFDLLRPPLPELTLFAGLRIGTGADLKHFSNATRSLVSAAYVAGRMLQHLRDLITHGKGLRLTNGGALAGRLFLSARNLGVNILTSAEVRSLIISEGAVEGAQVEDAGTLVSVRAKRGVVLAAGGFPQDLSRRRALFPHDRDNRGHLSPAPAANTGDGLRLGESAGATVDTRYPNAAAWVPVSRVPRKDGTVGVFPHFVDRGKPGLIAVTTAGRRFVNEANSYHDFMQGLFKACHPGQRVRAFLVVDHKFIRRYGLGFAKPYPLPLGPHLRSGYLLRGHSLRELAALASIDPAGLEATVSEYNAAAGTGVDPVFGRGTTAYNRFYGDATVTPNPCLASILKAPFYAVEVVPGDLGTFAGLLTNGHAQVLSATGEPIPGLYAVGNDMASIMGGNYPGAGITLGPAITFAYIVARELAGTSA